MVRYGLQSSNNENEIFVASSLRPFFEGGNSFLVFLRGMKCCCRPIVFLRGRKCCCRPVRNSVIFWNYIYMIKCVDFERDLQATQILRKSKLNIENMNNVDCDKCFFIIIKFSELSKCWLITFEVLTSTFLMDFIPLCPCLVLLWKVLPCSHHHELWLKSRGQNFGAKRINIEIAL